MKLALCYHCRHLHKGDPEKPTRCSAFPAGVPLPILMDDYDHRLPYPDDGGIRYEHLNMNAADRWPNSD